MTSKKFRHFSLLPVRAILLCLLCYTLPPGTELHAQSIHRQDALTKSATDKSTSTTEEIPLEDYLGLLQQIAPAAQAGAKVYLAVFQQRCGRAMSSNELRLAIAQGNGDPILMGLIRASQQRDASALSRLSEQLRCPKEAKK